MKWFVVLLMMLLVGFFPIIPALLCNWLGMKLDESNSTIATLPWLMFFTLPIAGVGLIGWLFYGVLLLFRGPSNYW